MERVYFYLDATMRFPYTAVCNLNYLAQFSPSGGHTGSAASRRSRRTEEDVQMRPFFKTKNMKDSLRRFLHVSYLLSAGGWTVVLRFCAGCWEGLFWCPGSCVMLWNKLICVLTAVGGISIFSHCTYLNLIPGDSNRKGYIWTF